MSNNKYYHFSDIDSLEITQSMDGEREPMFGVKLKPGARGRPEAIIENSLSKDLLYVFQIGKYNCCYLPGDQCTDLSAYREVLRKFNETRQPA